MQNPIQYNAQVLTNTYEKCPKHPQNDIILFCLAGNCKEPLCKECCKLHVQWHNSSGFSAEIDTVDSVRQNLYNDVHTLKIKFEEERAILHHFSDGDHSELLKSIHTKLDRVKKNLVQAVNDYCAHLEEQVKSKLQQHRSAHPGEKKELHHKLNSIIQDLDQQEKGLQQQKYIRTCLQIITEERSHDLEGLSTQIDNALKHYLSNMFDVFVHEDHLQKIISTFHEYVEIHQANLQEELDIYTKKLREGKKIYGIDNQQQYLPQQQQSKIPQLYSTTIPSQKVQSSIYDQPKFSAQNPFYTSQIQSSQTKQYESRLQTNNEKLKQYYN